MFPAFGEQDFRLTAIRLTSRIPIARAQGIFDLPAQVLPMLFSLFVLKVSDLRLGHEPSTVTVFPDINGLTAIRTFFLTFRRRILNHSAIWAGRINQFIGRSTFRRDVPNDILSRRPTESNEVNQHSQKHEDRIQPQRDNRQHHKLHAFDPRGTTPGIASRAVPRVNDFDTHVAEVPDVTRRHRHAARAGYRRDLTIRL